MKTQPTFQTTKQAAKAAVASLLSAVMFGAFLQAGVLHEYAKEGDMKMVAGLLKAGADLAQADDDEGLTALHFASRNGHLEVVKLLVREGADVNAKGKKEFKVLPFHSACEGAWVRVADYFVKEHDADPAAKVTLRGPGLGAIISYKLNGVQLALLHFRRVLQDAPLDNQRLFEFVKYMDAKGVPIPNHMPFEQQKGFKLSLPIMAASVGAVETLKYLLEEKKIPLIDPKNQTDAFPQPIHLAAQSGSLDTVKYLASKGEDLGAAYAWKGGRMLTIHFAAYAPNKDAAAELIAHLLTAMALENADLKQLATLLKSNNKKKALELVEAHMKKTE